MLVFRDVADQFLEQLKATVLEFYGDDPRQSPDYGRIVNSHHFDRLVGLLTGRTVYFGGQHDRGDRYIAPTVLVNVPLDAPVMQGGDLWPDSPGLDHR